MDDEQAPMKTRKEEKKLTLKSDRPHINVKRTICEEKKIGVYSLTRLSVQQGEDGRENTMRF